VRRIPPFTGLIAFAAWIAAEIMAFNLVASWTGGGLAFFLLVMKSVLGALFVQRALRRKVVDLMRRGSVTLDGPDAVKGWVKGLGGMLLILPGFAAGLVGLALLSPPTQRWIAARSGVKPASPRDIDLTDNDWREMPNEPAKRLRRPGDA
jgi:UPF0716 family protein affecting phage T7 exclusion